MHEVRIHLTPEWLPSQVHVCMCCMDMQGEHICTQGLHQAREDAFEVEPHNSTSVQHPGEVQTPGRSGVQSQGSHVAKEGLCPACHTPWSEVTTHLLSKLVTMSSQ
jgi:hypothetical protein